MKHIFIGNSPIRKNLLANGFGIGVQLLNQIVLVPFYILFWGNELYSDWIVISALTTIFAMSDVGLNNVIQNRFSIKQSEGNRKECDSLLTNNFLLVAASLLITLLGCITFVGIWDITEVMNLHLLNRAQANFVFLILVVKVFVGMFSGIENAIYRATHNASISVYMDQIGNLAVALLILGCILLKVSVTIMCVLICLPQLILLLVKHFHARKYYCYHFSLFYADWPLFKSVLWPSLSFMAFPLGNTIVLQGYTLVVNGFFGADAVVLYNTTRTLCNFVKTLLGTLQNSVWPEYSIAYGKKDFARMRHLHRKILKITIAVSFCAGVGILVLGPIIYKIWTHNAVDFSYSLMGVYVVAIFIESLWTSSSVTLMATNNHTKLGITYILSASLAIALAWMMVRFDKGCSLAAMTGTLILMHILIASYTIKAGFRLTNDKLCR